MGRLSEATNCQTGGKRSELNPIVPASLSWRSRLGVWGAVKRLDAAQNR